MIDYKYLRKKIENYSYLTGQSIKFKKEDFAVIWRLFDEIGSIVEQSRIEVPERRVKQSKEKQSKEKIRKLMEVELTKKKLNSF